MTEPGMNHTVIRRASWLVAWDGHRHVYLRDADIAFSGPEITFVGHGYDGPVTTEIDGRDRLVMPGFVNIHCHPTAEPLLRGLTEDRKSRRLGMSTMYEYLQVIGRSNRTLTLTDSLKSDDPQIYEDSDARSASARFGIAELLKSGVTTLTDYSPNRMNWFDEVTSIGIRTCIAPSFRSGRFYTDNGHEVLYEWNEGAGWQAFEEAMSVLDAVEKDTSGLLFGMVAAGQVDTCTADLLTTAKAAARERKLPMQIHAAQSMFEFREMTRRHGKTPIAWLEELGLLDDWFIIGHCIFLDQHSWNNWPERNDLDRLASAGVSVAHCPTQFARGGVLLENFGLYRNRGINIGFGTDTAPHNFVEELRWGMILSKVAARDVDAASVAEVFHAGTVGGATALHREDIGRLKTGCKADIVLVDTTHPTMQPLRDPLRNLLFSGMERPIADVYINGKPVVRDGDVLTINVDGLTETLNIAQQRALKGVQDRDWANREADEMFPPVLPIQQSLH